jgi:hypothetical protein
MPQETIKTVRTGRHKTVRQVVDVTAFLGMALIVVASAVVTVIYQ